jgi:hypothetical protein
MVRSERESDAQPILIHPHVRVAYRADFVPHPCNASNAIGI